MELEKDVFRAFIEYLMNEYYESSKWGKKVDTPHLTRHG